MADKTDKSLFSKVIFPAIIVAIIAAGITFCALYEPPNPATHADIDLSGQKETPIESEEKQHEEKAADSSMLASVSQAKTELDAAWSHTEEWIKENGNEGDQKMLENYRNEYLSLAAEAENTSGITERQAGETIMNIRQFMDDLNSWTEMER